MVGSAKMQGIDRERLRVCIVTHSLKRTEGQGNVNLEIVKYLSARGHDVHIVSQGIDKEIATLPRVRHVPINTSRGLPTEIARSQVFALRVSLWLRRHANEFDIVHLNGAITYASADVNTSHYVHSQWANLLLHNLGVEHTAYNYYQNLVTQLNGVWEKFAYRQSRSVVAVSEFCRRGLVEDAHVPAERVTVIPNGVDCEEFRPATPADRETIRRELGIPVESTLLLFAGAVKTNRKNLDLPLRAMTSLASNCHLLVVGEFEGSSYPGKVRRLGLEERVHFTGHRADLSRLMPCADLFVFPSHYDTFGLTVLEAMACGLPPIITRKVGCVELITHGVDGFVLADGDDVDGLRRVIQALVHDPVARLAAGRAARTTAERHTWTLMAQRYEALYTSIVQCKDAPSSSRAHGVFPANGKLASQD